MQRREHVTVLLDRYTAGRWNKGQELDGEVDGNTYTHWQAAYRTRGCRSRNMGVTSLHGVNKPTASTGL
jgi:hypothetical protein